MCKGNLALAPTKVGAGNAQRAEVDKVLGLHQLRRGEIAHYVDQHYKTREEMEYHGY